MIFLQLFSRLQEVGTVPVSSLAFFNKALQINALPWFEVAGKPSAGLSHSASSLLLSFCTGVSLLQCCMWTTPEFLALKSTK